jgi:hypothetical protein
MIHRKELRKLVEVSFDLREKKKEGHSRVMIPMNVTTSTRVTRPSKKDEYRQHIRHTQTHKHGRMAHNSTFSDGQVAGSSEDRM